MNDLRLLHLCDSLFPLGGFAYSDGLEAAASVRLQLNTTGDAVLGSEGLREWLDVCLDQTIGRLEAPAMWRAWPAFHDLDWDALIALDEELTALRPSASTRRSNRAMGLRLLTAWHALHPDVRLAHALALSRTGRIGPVLCVAFAAACASIGIDPRRSVEAFAYTRLASTMSAAMRVMPIGQAEAHALLARALDRVPAIVDAAIARDRTGARLETFSPAMDLAAMTQQYLHSRLFRS